MDRTSVRVDANLISVVGDRIDGGSSANVNAFLDEEAVDLSGDVVVLPAGDVWPALENRDGAAETAEHLAELEGDIAATDDDEVFGKSVEMEDPVVVEPVNVAEAGDRWFRRPCSDVEEHVGGDQRTAVDFHDVTVVASAREAGLAVKECQAIQFLERFGGAVHPAGRSCGPCAPSRRRSRP